jgi:hypothetical protein
MEVSGKLHAPTALSPRERAPRWFVLRAGLDAMVKRKFLAPYEDSNPPIIRLIAQPYTTELFRLTTEYRTKRIKPNKMKKVAAAAAAVDFRFTD